MTAPAATNERLGGAPAKEPTPLSPPPDRVVHLTISGDLGSGKSTVARLISEKLNMGILSTGDIHRSIARSLSMSALDANHAAESDPTIDDKIDSTTVKLSQESKTPVIFDSRMAWHFVENAVRVRLVVDPAVAAQRVLLRAATDVESYGSLDEAVSGLNKRSESEIRRFIDTYGVDISDLRHYQLVIDTSDASPAEVASEIVTVFRQPAPTRTQLRLSPTRIVSAARRQGGAGTTGDIIVDYRRPVFHAVSGNEKLARAVSLGKHLEQAILQSPASE
ncbi:MAG: cytidylate kinase family protein [Propionibacteriaceae bacterium]|jgi:predicted cytidylate kinase|nr:cytidylate kinase family protein [Propionibacteriaceae bacterium]